MCTTGVLHLSGDGHVLFKNKDFGRRHLDDRIWLDADVFGVLGMTTWDGDDAASDSYSGFSVGANRHGLLCCDSNVATLPDHLNYDDLTEIALRQGTDVPTAVAAIEHACSRSPVSWANLVLIDPSGAATVEVREHRVHVTPVDRPTARSNHHVALGPHEVGQESATSEARLASAQRQLDEARRLDDVMALLASHDDGDTGVCNHRDLTTVYSYLLHWHDGVCDLHVSQGHPCRAERVSLRIPFGDGYDPDAVSDFLARYPSAHHLNAALAG